MENINPNVKIMEYAVRGPLVIRATQIEKELEKVITYWFYDLTTHIFHSLLLIYRFEWLVLIYVFIATN